VGRGLYIDLFLINSAGLLSCALQSGYQHTNYDTKYKGNTNAVDKRQRWPQYLKAQRQHCRSNCSSKGATQEDLTFDLQIRVLHVNSIRLEFCGGAIPAIDSAGVRLLFSAELLKIVNPLRFSSPRVDALLSKRSNHHRPRLKHCLGPMRFFGLSCNYPIGQAA